MAPYLRVAQSDLEPGEYVPFLEHHRDLINTGTNEHRGDAWIMQKYEWLRHTHNAVVGELPDDFLAYYGSTPTALHIE